jgi:predicted aldo/keto reductase-like oxidoreductase
VVPRRQKEALAVDAVHVNFNLSVPRHEKRDFAAVVARVVAEKMPVVVMEPLLGGKLATGLPKEAVNQY